MSDHTMFIVFLGVSIGSPGIGILIGTIVMALSPRKRKPRKRSAPAVSSVSRDTTNNT